MMNEPIDASEYDAYEDYCLTIETIEHETYYWPSMRNPGGIAVHLRKLAESNAEKLMSGNLSLNGFRRHMERIRNMAMGYVPGKSDSYMARMRRASHPMAQS